MTLYKRMECEGKGTMVVKQILVTLSNIIEEVFLQGCFKGVFVSNGFQPLGDIVPNSATRIQKTRFELIIPRSRGNADIYEW